MRKIRTKESAAMKVGIIGASDKEVRTSNTAQKRLMKAGHRVFPISADGKEILGVKGYRNLEEVGEPLDTVTIYVNPGRLDDMIESITQTHPRRCIFNPGSESPAHQATLVEAGIHVVEACTLVLLSTGQFERA